MSSHSEVEETHSSGDPQPSAGALNALLRGEIAAAESYESAMNSLAARMDIEELQHMRNDHHAAVARLRERILQEGGDPPDSSGAWGTFTAAVTMAAASFGTNPTLSALRQGEEHGIAEYEKTVESGTLSSDCRRLIEGELLPLCRHHVSRLQELSENGKT